MIYNIMDEESERAKLLDFGLTSDVVDIVIAKKKELERKRSCVIIPIPEPIPIDIIPEPETTIVEIKEESKIEIKEESKIEIKQENIFYGGMPIWKRRLLERTYK